MGRIIIPVLLVVLIISGCQPYDIEDLSGSWKATVVIDNGDTARADLTLVRLNMDVNRGFTYQMTSNDHLSGQYSIKEELLHLYAETPLLDTIVVQILSLDDDALVLRMNHEGMERQMHLSRE